MVAFPPLRSANMLLVYVPITLKRGINKSTNFKFVQIYGTSN